MQEVKRGADGKLYMVVDGREVEVVPEKIQQPIIEPTPAPLPVVQPEAQPEPLTLFKVDKKKGKHK